jgi:hypothetical protein
VTNTLQLSAASPAAVTPPPPCCLHLHYPILDPGDQYPLLPSARTKTHPLNTQQLPKARLVPDRWLVQSSGQLAPKHGDHVRADRRYHRDGFQDLGPTRGSLQNARS